ncbi:MAG: hypothetical protein AAF726_01335 [Planctomycetota bacterium]
MKTNTLVLAALVVPSIALSAPRHDVRVLLAVGDALEGGRTVVRIRELDLGPRDHWAALVDVRQPGDPARVAAVFDGEVVLETGQLNSAGETVAGIGSVRVTGEGSRLVQYFVESPASGFAVTGVLEVDGVELLRAGKSLTGPGLGPNLRIAQLRNCESAGDFVVCNVVLDFGAEEHDAALRFAVHGGRVLWPRLLWREGLAPGGLSRPIQDQLPSVAVAADGSYVTTFRLHGPFDGATAGLTGNGAVFETGTSAPASAGTWRCASPRVACAPGGRFAVGGTLAASGVSQRGVVASSHDVLALEGEPLAASPAETLDAFSTAEVAMSEAGEVAYSVPLVGGDDVVVLADGVVLRTGDPTVDGRAVAHIDRGRRNGLDVSASGHLVAVIVHLEGAVEAIALVQREIGDTGSCGGIPNSSGKPSRLFAFGSHDVDFNELRLEARGLPADVFGVVLASRVPGYVPNPGGSPGTLCLSGSIGKLGPALHSGDAGTFSRRVDLTRVPTQHATIAAAPGETWWFQVWHRDAGPGGVATSTFGDPVAVALR